MGQTTRRHTGTAADTTSVGWRALRATTGLLAATSGLRFGQASPTAEASGIRSVAYAWADRYEHVLGWDAPTSAHVKHALREANGQPTPGALNRCLNSQAQEVAYMTWRAEEDALRGYLSQKAELRRQTPWLAHKNVSMTDMPRSQDESLSHFIAGGSIHGTMKMPQPVGCCRGYEGWVQDFVEHEHVVSLLNGHGLHTNCTPHLRGVATHTGFGDPQSWTAYCSVSVQCASHVWNFADPRPVCESWREEAEDWSARLHSRAAIIERGFISLPSIMCARSSPAERFALAVEDIGYQYDRIAFLLGYFGPPTEYGHGGRRLETGVQREMGLHMSLLESISQQHPASHASWSAAMDLVLPHGWRNGLL